MFLQGRKLITHRLCRRCWFNGSSIAEVQAIADCQLIPKHNIDKKMNYLQMPIAFRHDDNSRLIEKMQLKQACVSLHFSNTHVELNLR